MKLVILIHFQPLMDLRFFFLSYSPQNKIMRLNDKSYSNIVFLLVFKKLQHNKIEIDKDYNRIDTYSVIWMVTFSLKGLDSNLFALPVYLYESCPKSGVSSCFVGGGPRPHGGPGYLGQTPLFPPELINMTKGV